MTEREALLWTRETWSQILDGNTTSKWEAANKVAKANGIGDPIHSCFCCQFVVGDKPEKSMFCATCQKGRSTETLGREMLTKCPLRKLWPDGCESPDSPYVAFLDADESEYDKEIIQDVAAKIVDGCDAALKELHEQTT